MAVSDEKRKQCTYYPVYLDVRGRRTLVVGGGEVAARKAGSLVDAGAHVRIVASKPCERIESWAREGSVELERRAFRSGDVGDARLVYCATDDRAVNEAVHAEADGRGVFVNVVDDPAHCSFIVPSVVRRGALQIAVSTGGCAPTVAKRIRRELEERYPADLEGYIELLGCVRDLVKARVAGSEADRAPYFEAACAPSLLERYRAGEVRDAEAAYVEIARAVAAVEGAEGRAVCEEGGDAR